jgi:hypothetical protein
MYWVKISLWRYPQLPWLLEHHHIKSGFSICCFFTKRIQVSAAAFLVTNTLTNDTFIM